jgi:hypothetical protein
VGILGIGWVIGIYNFGKKVMFLPILYFYFWELRGKNLGKTWNFCFWCSTRYKLIWELRGNNLGITPAFLIQKLNLS